MIIIVNLATHYAGYLESGYELPAPAVPVRGMPAYARATAGLPIDLAHTLVFVCTADQLERSTLASDVKLRFPHVTTKVVNEIVFSEAHFPRFANLLTVLVN